MNNHNSRTERSLELQGNVGFCSLPDQLVSKLLKEGFVFNIMCVGETGIGKSTLVESLFNMNLGFEACSRELDQVELRSKSLGEYNNVDQVLALGTNPLNFLTF